MKIRYAAAAAAALSIGMMASGAGAVSVSLIDSSSNGAGNDANTYAAGFGGYTPVGASWSSDPLVTPPPGNVTNSYLSPFANTDIVDTQSYFSVGGEVGANGAGSPVTLTFANTVVGAFQFLWGSIDSSNRIDFLNGAEVIDSFGGSDIISRFGLSGSAQNYNQVALLTFSNFGSGGLTGLRFTSDTPAFEFAMAAPAAVPLPASLLLLFGSLGGLAGLGFLTRRHRDDAAI